MPAHSIKRWLYAFAVILIFGVLDAALHWAGAFETYQNNLPWVCHGTWQKVPFDKYGFDILHIYPAKGKDGEYMEIITEDAHHQEVGDLPPGEEGAWKCNGKW